MLGIVFAFAALFVVLPLVFAVLVMAGAALSGVAVLLVSGVHAGKGILIGIVLGYLLFRAYRKNRTAAAMEEDKQRITLIGDLRFEAWGFAFHPFVHLRRRRGVEPEVVGSGHRAHMGSEALTIDH